MTKKDYIAIAKVIADARAEFVTSQPVDPINCAIEGTLNIVTYNLADVFAAENGKFKRGVFYSACGVK